MPEYEEVSSQPIESIADESTEPVPEKEEEDEYRPEEDFELRTKQVLRSIEADGPEYEFIFEYDNYVYRTTSGFAVDSDMPVHISVFDETGGLIQELEFIYNGQWGPGQEDFLVVDFNFDGYADILCLEGVGGVKANHFYVGWTWNPDTEQFEEVDLFHLVNLSVHASDRSLRSVSAAWAAGHYYYIYRFIDGELTLTNELALDDYLPARDGQGNFIANHFNGTPMECRELVNGEMVDVFPEMICDTEEGLKIIEDYLTGPDSIWFGENSPSFYASAYGDGLTGDFQERDYE